MIGALSDSALADALFATSVLAAIAAGVLLATRNRPLNNPVLFDDNAEPTTLEQRARQAADDPWRE